MSTNNFEAFAARVNANWKEMSKHELFIADIDGDALFQTYLNAFPEGTNPIFRERTEHDCSCCKNFIRNIGRVICLEPGAPRTVWDGLDAEEGALGFYASVASGMEHEVMRRPIKSLFRTSEAKYGNQFNFEGEIKWDHFWGDIATKHRCTNPAEAIGKYASAVQVLTRGLTELKPEALATIIELIEAKALYRGEEHLAAVRNFAELQRAFMEHQHSDFTWRNAHRPAALFRNTVIGTLAVDLSNGVDLDAAVKAFETKVAPQNYKRTTAVVTPGMVAQAMKIINTLGLEESLDRRHATLADVTVNDVLWVSGAARSVMRGGLEDMLMKATKSKVKADIKAPDITADQLLTGVLPTTKKLEVLLTNEHLNHFMSITTAAHSDAPGIFKWSNQFAWTYDGEVADSIKERVKKAGGSVEGDLCCRLAWDYTDDLDFHMVEPGGGHIYYMNRRRASPNGGMLDVDANGADGIREDPVENIFYQDSREMRDGTYSLRVNNFSRRSSGVGFEVEIDVYGQVTSLVYDKALRGSETVPVAEIKVAKGRIAEVTPNPEIKIGHKSIEKWGVMTQNFVEIDTLILSPNHWGEDAVGNKHWFFLSSQIRNPGTCRGFYNEFLRNDLNEHRKVFDLIASKTKVERSDHQLSGLGFSSTLNSNVTVRCDGRVFNVQF